MATLPTTTEKDKKDLVAQLRKTPIVQLACERVGVSRASYYRWRKDDKIFARAADHAIESGKFFINDLAESKLIQLIQSSNLTAIIFWLKHNHPSYASRMIHEYDLTCPVKSTEEEHREGRTIAWYLAHQSETDQERDYRLSREDEEVEKEVEDDNNLKKYQEE